ncbi:MAG: hypothetical protein JNM17_25280 [Archangium sp.]|nr:hypothetical protein [Archangium sp.]
MNRVLPVLSLCVALIALALALVPREAPPPPPQQDAPRAGPSDDVLELRKRVELLEDDSRGLWDRVVLLERRGAFVSDAGGVADPALLTEVLRLRDEVNSLSTGQLAMNGDAGRAAIAEVMKQVQAEQQQQRTAERFQYRQQRATEYAQRWKSFVNDAKLSNEQQRSLEERLAMEDAQRRALFERNDGTVPGPDALRALMTQRRETEKLMRTTLEPAQFEKFQELRREERGGR